MDKTTKKLLMSASGAEFLGNLFSNSKEFELAADFYHLAADKYQQADEKLKSSICRQKWFLSEIGISSNLT